MTGPPEPPDGSSSDDQLRLARAQEWADRNVRVQPNGRVTFRPVLRAPVLVGVGAAALVTALSAALGQREVAAVVLVLVIGLAVASGAIAAAAWLIGYAKGPRGAFAPPNAARRAASWLFMVCAGSIAMAAVLILLDSMLTTVGLYD